MSSLTGAERARRYREARKEQALAYVRDWKRRQRKKAAEIKKAQHDLSSTVPNFNPPYVLTDKGAQELLTAIFKSAFNELKHLYMRESFCRWYTRYKEENGNTDLALKYYRVARSTKAEKNHLEQWFKDVMPNYYDHIDGSGIIREARKQADKEKADYFIKSMKRRKVPNGIIEGYKKCIVSL